MPNSTLSSSEDFLASTADLVNVLTHFAGSSPRHSAQHRQDLAFVHTALSNLLPEVPTTTELPTPQPASLLGVSVPARQGTTVGTGAATSGRSVAVGMRDAKTGVRRYQYCQCGHCKWCLDNARWDRIFNEKFADPTYYASFVVRHNSTLAATR
jgi:hypothetical protein